MTTSDRDLGSGAQVALYEDYLCERCAQLERALGRQIESLLRRSNGAFTVSPVGIFDRLSTPPGYSTRCARAVAATADLDEFCRARRALLLACPAWLGAADLYTEERITLALRRGGIPQDRVEALLASDGNSAIEANFAGLTSALPGKKRAVPMLATNGSAERPEEMYALIERLFENLPD